MPHVHFDESFGTNPAENYERFFVPSIGEPLARDLIARADPEPSDRVLDVACGTGIVARLLSNVVGPDGTLAGLDPNAGMLAVARTVTPASAQIDWYEGPAEQIPLAADSFDVVLCQMGLQFMTDRAVALGEMRRVLRPGGRLLLSVPGPLTGIFDVLASAMKRHIDPQAAGFVARVFSLHDVDEVEGLMQDAGFVDVSVEATDHELELPPPKEFLWQYIHSTPLSMVVSQADEETLAKFEAEVLDGWSDSVRGELMTQAVRTVIASGTKATPTGVKA